MTLEVFNSKYVYKKDKDVYGVSEVWVEPKEVNGSFLGDCEDYCIYLKRNVSEFKDWDYYYCELNGNGHCVLYRDGKVIDCNCRRVLGFDTYCKMYNVVGFKKYSKFVVACKMLVGKIVSWVC